MSNPVLKTWGDKLLTPVILDCKNIEMVWSKYYRNVLNFAGVSKELQNLLLGLLHPDPKKRLTADQALSLPAIKKILIRKSIKDAFRKSVRYR